VSFLRKQGAKRALIALFGLAVVALTFAYFLPKIANYADVWKIVQGLTWKQVLALAAATVLNLVTFAPPWMAALPGLRYWQAFRVTQASTALTIVVPAGIAAGVAGSYGILRRWGFAPRDVTRAITLTGLWNQFANLSFPLIAVFALAVSHESTAALATVAFIGAAVLGIVIAGFVLVLVSDRIAGDIGDQTARLVSWVRGKLHRAPVTWGGAEFERFRREAGELLERRWHVLTLATYAGQLTVFVLLLVCLRTLGVTSDQVSVVEAFAAWSVARIVGSVPITPGGLGVVELALTGTLVGFGGHNAPVVAAVLVYRFLTAVPTLVLGLISALTLRGDHPEPSHEFHPVGAMPAERGESTLEP
jgi:putative heme transporter